MAQKTFVILINLVIDQCLLTSQLRRDGMFETLDNLFENGLVEHQLLALHHRHDVVTGQQFTALQDNTIGTGIEHVNPKFLVQYLARKDEHFHLFVEFFGLTTDFNTNGGRTAQSKVEQHEVGLLLFDQSPKAGLIFCSPNNLSFGNLMTYNAFSTFEFEGHVLDNNHLKFFHCIWVM